MSGLFPFQFNSVLFNQRTQTTRQVRRVPEYIEVRDPATNKPVAFLSPEGDELRADTAIIDNELNGVCKLEFELPLACEKWQYLTNQYRIIAGGREFVVANPDAKNTKREGLKKWGKVLAPESWALLGKDYAETGISNDPQRPTPPILAVIILSGGSDLSGGRYPVGSAGHALYALLQGTGWTVGTVDVGGTFDLETEKESVLANINKVQELWGGYLVWDSINKTVSLRSESGWQNYTGFGARYAKNLKSITRIDDRNITTKLYPFGADDLNIGSVNGGVIFLENKSYSNEELIDVWVNQDIKTPQALKDAATAHLAKICQPRHMYSLEMLDLRTIPGYEHETFDIGHLIDIVDEELGINAQVRIIRHRYNVFQPWHNQIDVGDPIEKIAASIANSIKAADYVKQSIKPNASLQNLLKAIINTAATEINGASGDYTLIDGVSTWLDRDDVTGELTGKLVRITPQGLIISYDGGQTWKLAISGEGIHADAGWVGKLNAGVVTVGADTTFESGYDPTQIVAGSSVGMGVDSDCVGLWHFDGSLNSHKGVATDSDALFGGGCFGQGLNVATGKHLKAPTTDMLASEGVINFRAKNLSASANGSVLVDLPKSDNSQGIKVGISNNAGHVGELFLADSDKVSKTYTETTQADFNTGTLTNVAATSAGDLELATDGYTDVCTTANAISGGDQSGQPASNAYDNDDSTIWGSSQTGTDVSGNAYNGQDFGGVAKTIKRVTLKQFTSGADTGWCINSAKLQYWNGSVWADAQTLTLIKDESLQTFEIAVTYSGTKWRLLANANTASGYQWVLREVQMMEIAHKSLGTRIKEIDISGANPAGGTKIEWSKTTPTGTSIKVEIALSTDGGSTYGAYQEATSGSSIPGIATDTNLSNARLKVRETLSTTDTSVTPQLHSLSFTIWEKQASTVYGPNKSMLTAWDSISLAWKSDRLSLVVNDSESCFIENPGLPTALGNYLFIGTDRNGANAINTLVDELRIDKVYRDVATRTAWHKTGVPFYTSEDMKQWPGYLRAESDGIKVYDSSNALRVLLGSWLESAVRKYGIKIIGGRIYASVIQSGEEGATSYIKLDAGFEPLEVIEDGKTALTIWAYDGGRIQIYDTVLDDMVGQISPMNDAMGQGLKVHGRNNSGSGRDICLQGRIIRIDGNPPYSDQTSIFLDGYTNVVGNLNVQGSIAKSGALNYVEPTLNYGTRLLNAVEAPELKYYDSGRATLINGEAIVYFDPIYLEVIEPDTDLTPWLFKTEVYGLGEDIRVIEWGENYFKVKEENGGTSNRKFGWWFEATRINYAGIRLMEVVD